MKIPNLTTNQMILGAVVIGGALLYFKGFRGVTSAAARGAVGAVGGVAEGAVYGVSDFVGLPSPELTACEQAKKNGDTWAASFDCPVGEFLRYLGS